MKSITYLTSYLQKRIAFSLIFLFFAGPLVAQILERSCVEKTTFYNKIAHAELEIATNNYVKQNNSIAFPRGKINIPVVVHIVFPTEKENISNAQVFSQIDALNRDFNQQNNNLDRVHPDFEKIIGNVGFNFCLATKDPSGQPTTGITRTSTNADFVYSRGETWIYHTEEGGKTAWNTNQYLNIWVTKTGLGIAGFGSKPNQNPPDEDGVILSVDYFGQSEPALPNFQLGRTGTHEVAHYFNVFHNWGIACDHDDFVADTPFQSSSYNGCPNIDESSCDSRDLTANFMNYSQDACLAMFTKGQVMRMQAALIYARSELLNEHSCEPNLPIVSRNEIKVYPNPASYYFCIEVGDEALTQIPYFIYDSKGAKMEEGIVTPNSLQHFPAYQNGVYFIQFLNGDENVLVKKVVINN